MSRPDATVTERVTPATTTRSSRVVRIEPVRGFRPIDVRELASYRDLAVQLVRRDVTLRYRQTAFGIVWAIGQPLLTVLLLAFVFGKVARLSSEGLPYIVFALAGMVPWLFFLNALVLGGNSLVANAPLVSKVYFPRVLVPVGAMLAGAVDLAVGFVVLLVVALAHGIVPGVQAAALVPVMAIGLLASTGVAVGLAAMNVRYRDVRQAIPFLSQLWFFATPVIYPTSLLEKPWSTIAAINPMTGVVEGFRWALLGVDPFPGVVLLISLISAIGIAAIGLAYFARVEPGFADVV